MSKYIKECYKETINDWCGNYKDNFVKVVLIYNSIWKESPNDQDRLYITGTDDIMMEYDGDFAEQKFNEILKLKYISFDNLKEIGLYSI